MRDFVLLLILLAISGSAGCSVFRPKEHYLAKVNQETITMEDLKEEFSKRHSGHEKFLSGDVETKRFLKIVIDQRLLIQEAYRLGLQYDPEIQRLTAGFQEQKLVDSIVRKEIQEKSRASDNEVRAVYDGKMGEEVVVRQIAVMSQDEAEAIRNRVRSGEDFESLARDFSVAPSRKYGGLLFPLGWGKADPEWERVAFGLSPGETSPVFRSGIGYEILRLESKRTVEKPDFPKVEEQIRSILERRKNEARREEFLRSLREKYAVRFTDIALGVGDLKNALEQNREEILATWAGGSVTVSYFASRLNIDLFSTVPPDEVSAQIRAVLHDLVDLKLMYAEAMAKEYDKDPEVARKVRKFREGLMENMLYGKYILPDLKVTGEEVKEYYQKNPREFVYPEKRRVAQILLESPDSAQEVLEKIRAGDSFDALARTYSKDAPTKDLGGEVGWFEQRQIPPALEPTVWSLKAGEVGGPVRTEAGFHIVKLLEVRPAMPKGFPEAEKEIEKKLLMKKSEEKVNFWLEKLRTVSRIEIREPL